MNLSERMLSLDVLRGLAVLLVLGRHMPVLLGSSTFSWQAILGVWQRGGWMGVDLFFVLSGFLVSGLLFREYERSGSMRVARFWIRRGLKIYPAFYALILVSVGLLIVARAGPLPIRAILCEVFFVQNYGPALWDHTWSLAVEEHFYLVLPLLLLSILWLKRHSADPFRPLMWVFVVVAALTFVLRVHNAMHFTYSHKTHLFPTHLRLDSLLFGVALSYLYHFRRSGLLAFTNGRESLLTIVAILLAVPAFVLPLEESFFIQTLGLTGCYLAGGLLLIAWLSRPLPNHLLTRLVSGVGVYSYSIYLWHLFVLRVLSAKWPGLMERGRIPWTFYLSYVIGSVLFGFLMARLVELPFITIRDRWFPSFRALPQDTVADSEPRPAAKPNP